MITIITGSTHVGKTSLAQKLLEKEQVPYVSIDHLKMGLIRSGHTNLTPLSADADLTDYLWPIVVEMIKTAIENNQSLIVEGCYVPGDWRSYFFDDYLSTIRYVCLIFSEQYIQESFDSIVSHASVIENRLSSDWLTKELLIEDNHYYLTSCQRHNLPYYLIDKEYNQVKLVEAIIENT